MPPRTPTPCCAQGCRGVTTTRYCEQHKHLGWEQHQAGRSRTERGYGREWEKLRGSILKRDKYLCQEHRRKRQAVSATDVDHIVAKAHGGTDELNNLEALCKSCHRKKTATERMKNAIKN